MRAGVARLDVVDRRSRVVVGVMSKGPPPVLNRVSSGAHGGGASEGKGNVDEYHVIELVGEGSFGKVYKARRKFHGEITAMKFIAKHGKTEKDIKSLRQEIEILRGLKHDNIIAMVDAFETKAEFCVVTEFAQGELFEVLEDDQCLPEDEVRAIARQLVRGGEGASPIRSTTEAARPPFSARRFPSGSVPRVLPFRRPGNPKHVVAGNE